MILSRMFINPQRRDARKLLSSPQAMHAAVLASFPPGSQPGRVLWRLDGTGSHQTSLLIVSPDLPDLTHLEEQAGWPLRPTGRSTVYDGFLDALRDGQTWAFRLTVNPTHRVTRGGKKQVLAHVTAAQQTQWLLARQEQLGVALAEGDDPSFSLQGREIKRFRRAGGMVTLGTATFGGALRVVDSEALRSALVEGVGRAKAYGCGLMTLARP